MRLSLSRVAELLSAELTGADPNKIVTGYSIDSRTIRPGELFFAVKGERFDGHDFALQALANGAAAAVVARSRISNFEVERKGPAAFITLDDPLRALQTLASAVRRLWGKPLIAVTGSAGKTTTKDAIAHVLGGMFRVHKSVGNFNNHFGLPLMLLKLEPDHDLAVVELGMSHAGEIATLAKIAQPDTGVVTVVAPVHLEFFKSIADIARAKYELIESLPASGTAVLNADDEYVSQFGRGFRGRVVTYGFSPTANVRAENFEARGAAGSAFDVVALGVRHRILLPLVGKHNAGNALATIATAMEQGITVADAAASLATFAPADNRGEVLRLGNITAINDCYNSNPKALSAMVDALVAMPAKRRIVVAGEMLELGPEGERMHRECGRHIAAGGIDFLLGVRGLAAPMVEEAANAGLAANFVMTPEEAGAWLARETRDGDVVLLKASRGVKLEKALEAWKSALDTSLQPETHDR